MKRYRFPLQSVRVVRSHQETVARDAFAGAVQALVQAEEALARARQRREDFATLLSTGRRGTFSAAAEAQSLAAYRQESVHVAEAERAVGAAKDKMEKARLAYLEAHQKLEALEHLDERGRAAHRLEVNRHEQEEFDGFSGGRVARTRFSRT